MNGQKRHRIVLLEHLVITLMTRFETPPLYFLYGEKSQKSFIDGFHIESIFERSRLYDWEITPHRHEDFLQILYIQSGDGEILLGHSKEKIQSPSLVIAPRLIPHGFNFDKNIQGYVLTINQSHLQQLLSFDMSLLEAIEIPIQLSFDKDLEEWRSIEWTLSMLFKEFSNSESWRSALVFNHLLNLLIGIARVLPKASIQANKGTRAALHVDRFKKLLDSRFREHLPITSYAEILGITQTQLNRVCREVLGKSALDVTHQRLLVEAQRDLIYTGISIKEIAYTLGFGDEAYFTKFFKRFTNKSPSQFRNESLVNMKKGSQ
jgi:AraC family transcriptional activator of pobA